jgi:rRNA biogenesis protein RRP5
MAFHLTTANIEGAKKVAERAFERISFRQEGERLNVWCAFMTLELKYGSEEGLQRAVERACQHNNPKHVYLRVCEMLEKEAAASSFSADSVQRGDEMFQRMCKKFKSKKKVWLAHVEFLLKTNRADEAFALSKKALLSLPPYKHVEMMTKVASLVFEFGNQERGRSLFEGLLIKYPKRLDLFFVFVDKEVKYGDLSRARALFEQQASIDPAREGAVRMKLSDKQMKSMFKKWYAFEESNGTDALRERVKAAARAYVENSM